MNNYNTFISHIQFQDRGLSPEAGFEIHHICPRSKGGKDVQENLIKLTTAEHVYAHYLLALQGDPKMIHAFNFLITTKADKETLQQFSKEDLQKVVKLREEALENNRKRMKLYNPMFSAETRQKVSASIKKYYRTHVKEVEQKNARFREAIKNDPSYSKRRSDNMKNYYKNHPEQKEIFRQRILKYKVENEVEYKAALKKAWDKPGYRESRSGDNHPMKKLENRQKAAINESRLWQDPAYKKSQSQAIKASWTPEKQANQSNILKNYYQDHPERKLQISETNKEKWKDPLFREKMSKARAGLHWYTNGIINTKARECPEGFRKGRVNLKKEIK